MAASRERDRCSTVGMSTLLLLLSGACSGEPSPNAEDAGGCESLTSPIRVEMGLGFDEYTSAANGESVDIVAGPQGGFHIWTALRVWDVPDRVTITLGARLESGSQVGPPSEVQVRMGDANAEGMRERAGLFTFIDRPSEIRGMPIILRADVDSCDASGAAELRLVAK
jgi:hypothetical protein